ncbi:hypothetical protein [Saccharomonospora iraqiensis]|uniref:hypothetical protein n=1 Tax=Saccharomonospora iraqiensis TaxID=52698 RepID=UPI00022DE991|nr:hypothetical protein [Saccharomonospora iraqiensis]
MAGRHRAQPRRPWAKPTAVGLLAATALVGTMALTDTAPPEKDHTTAVAAVAAGLPTPSSTPARSRSTDPTSSTAESTTPESTTTTSTTSTEPETTGQAPEEETTEAAATAGAEATVESCPTGLEGTVPHVAQVGNHLLERFSVDSVGGRAPRSNPSDHPAGLALDLMVGVSSGDALADYVVEHRDEFGVKYVIWRQRINHGAGWSAMADRGSATANHMDHVHVSFRSGVDVSVTC